MTRDIRLNMVATATYFGYDYGDGAIPMVATGGLNVTF